MKRFENLNSIINECDVHAQRLRLAYDHLLPMFPIKEEQLPSLSPTQVSFLDQLIYRFSKLQDAMGAKLFPMLVGMLQQDTDKMTFIDILNRLEKAELLPNARDWQLMWAFRNHLTHEYPDNPKLMVSNLNASLKYADDLLAYWQILRGRALEMKEQYETEIRG
jgi:hypothetical protein